MDDSRLLRPLGREIDAVVVVPGSKSIANRALVCAALAAGTSELTNVPDGDDTTAMIDGLTALGAGVESFERRVTIDRRARARRDRAGRRARRAGRHHVEVPHRAGRARSCADHDRRSPGAAAEGVRSAPRRTRAARCHGDGRRRMGAPAGDRARSGDRVGGVDRRRRVEPVHHGVDADRTVPTGGLATRPHEPARVAAVRRDDGGRDGGVRCARHRGHRGRRARSPQGDTGRAHWRSSPTPRRRATRWPSPPCAVAGSRSLASANLRSRAMPGSPTCSPRWGAGHSDSPIGTVVSRDAGTSLRGVDVDMSDISDLVPTLAVVALFAETPTRITGVGFIRGKESDRLGDLAGELRALGASIDETADGLVVQPSASRLGAGAAGDPPRPQAGDGVRRDRHGGPRHRRRRAARGFEELAGVLEHARRAGGVTPTVVAFDFDGTLTRSDSVVPFLRRVAGRRALARRSRAARPPSRRRARAARSRSLASAGHRCGLSQRLGGHRRIPGRWLRARAGRVRAA